MRILVEPDATAVAETAAALITEELAVPGPATLGLAGGSTPSATYDLLAAAPIEWERVTLWLGDERWVPPDDPASNARSAREHLGPAAAARLLAPDYALGDPAAAAASYASRLETLFTATGGRPGTILLGIGTDGHTASLFPEGDSWRIDESTYVAEYVDKLGAWRLSATIPLLASAHHVVFLVTGASKAPVVSEILDEAEPYPARRIAERAESATWILDAAAAAGLSRP